MTASYFELMDIDSASVVGFYATKHEALDVVRNAYRSFGVAGIDDLVLSEQTDEGIGNILAEGTDLLRLTIEAPLHPVVG